MAYTLDEFLKLNKGYTKSYNPATKTAGVQNTNTGKSISFQEGQGQNYGLGGLENDSHVISDLNKFKTSLGNVESVAPTTNAVTSPTNAYESPYSSQITDTLASISNRSPFSYDASSDEGLQAAQKSAMSAVSREAARRGMIYSDSNKSQLGKSSLELVPQFEQVAKNQYNQEGTDLYNQLNSLSGLESQNYNKYIDQRNADASAQESTRSNFIDTIGQYQGDYQAQINSVLNDNDPTNDWQADYLGTARQNKIANQGLDQFGKPLTVAEGMVSAEAQEALNAYNSGFRTPQVIEILKNAGYQFPSTGSYSGSGGATNTLETPTSTIPGFNVASGGQGVGGLTSNAPVTTSKDYLELAESLFNPANSTLGGDPQKVIDYVLSDNFYNVYLPRIGEDGINQLLEQAYGVMESEAKAGADETELATTNIKYYTNHIDTSLSDPVLDIYGEPTGKVTPNIKKVVEYIGGMLTNGTINEKTAELLADAYGI